MQDLLPRAEMVGRLLKERGETIVVAESSTGVLVKQKDLSASRIRSAVCQARTMRPVAMSPGGPAQFADAVEEIVPVGLELEAHDRSLIK